MKNIFQTDMNKQLIMPTFVLCHAYQEPIDTLSGVEDFSFKFVENGVDEISFSLARMYDGKVNDMFETIKDFQVIYIPEWEKHYQIQVSYTDDMEGTKKNITGSFLCKAELSQLILNNIEINTEADIIRDAYAVTSIYNADYPNMSLLNRILKDKAPHYSIKYVSPSLCGLVRSFSINGQSIDDFLTTTLAEEINCVVDYDSVDKTISLYDTLKVCGDCGYRGDYLEDECPKCGSNNVYVEYGEDTGIVISTSNIAEEITVDTDMDSVKTCFNITGGDEMMNAALLAVNPNGTSYIYGFSNDILSDMPETLRERIKNYNSLYASLQPGYKEIMNQIFDLYDNISYYQYEMTGIPEVNTNAEDELNKLKGSTLGNIGISSLSETTAKSVIDNAVLGIARLHLSKGYDVKIESSTFTYSSAENSTWSGRFTVSHYSNEEDVATSPSDISLTVTNDYETFVQQKIDKTLANKDAYGIDTDWSKYSLEYLKSYESAYNSCLEVLIQTGNLGMNMYTMVEQEVYGELGASPHSNIRYIPTTNADTFSEWVYTTDGVLYPDLWININWTGHEDEKDTIGANCKYMIVCKDTDGKYTYFCLSSKEAIQYISGTGYVIMNKYCISADQNMNIISIDDTVQLLPIASFNDEGYYYMEPIGSTYDYNISYSSFPNSNISYTNIRTKTDDGVLYPDLWTDVAWGNRKGDKELVKSSYSYMIITGGYSSGLSSWTYYLLKEPRKAYKNGQVGGKDEYYITVDCTIKVNIPTPTPYEPRLKISTYREEERSVSLLTYYSDGRINESTMASTYDYRDIETVKNYVTTDPQSQVCSELYAQYYAELKEIQAEMALRESTVSSLNSDLADLQNQQAEIVRQLDFREYLGEELYNIFCCYRRDEDYNNSNYISEGLNNADLLRKAEELLEVASVQLYKASQTKYSISGSLANFFLMKEFEEYKDEYKLGNWMYVQTNNGDVYKLRLNELSGDYASLNSLKPTFSNAYKSSEPIDMLKDTILKANGMASSYKYVSQQASSGNVASQTLADMMKNGLNAAHYRIMNADNQDIVIDEHGILCRELDELTGAYQPEQAKFISNLLCYTDDGWETVKQAIGKISYTDPELNKTVDKYGVIADTIIAADIYGSKFVGGDIYSDNYWSTPDKGSHFDLKEGTFELAGGNLTYDGEILSIKGDGAGLNISSNDSITGLESSLSVTAGEISSKVSKGEIISEINQSPETITINANKVDLNGYVTFNSLTEEGSTEINGANIMTGTITADSISSEYFTTQMAGGTAGWTICKHPTSDEAAYIYGNNGTNDNVVLKTGGSVAFACGFTGDYEIGENTADAGATVQIYHDGQVRCNTIRPVKTEDKLDITATSLTISNKSEGTEEKFVFTGCFEEFDDNGFGEQLEEILPTVTHVTQKDNTYLLNTSWENPMNLAIGNFPSYVYFTDDNIMYHDLWQIDWGSRESTRENFKSQHAYIILGYNTTSNSYVYMLSSEANIAYYNNDKYFVYCQSRVMSKDGVITSFLSGTSPREYLLELSLDNLIILGSNYDYRGDVEELQYAPYSNMPYEATYVEPEEVIPDYMVYTDDGTPYPDLWQCWDETNCVFTPEEVQARNAYIIVLETSVLQQLEHKQYMYLFSPNPNIAHYRNNSVYVYNSESYRVQNGSASTIANYGGTPDQWVTDLIYSGGTKVIGSNYDYRGDLPETQSMPHSNLQFIPPLKSTGNIDLIPQYVIDKALELTNNVDNFVILRDSDGAYIIAINYLVNGDTWGNLNTWQWKMNYDIDNTILLVPPIAAYEEDGILGYKVIGENVTELGMISEKKPYKHNNELGAALDFTKNNWTIVYSSKSIITDDGAVTYIDGYVTEMPYFLSSNIKQAKMSLNVISEYTDINGISQFVDINSNSYKYCFVITALYPKAYADSETNESMFYLLCEDYEIVCYDGAYYIKPYNYINIHYGLTGSGYYTVAASTEPTEIGEDWHPSFTDNGWVYTGSGDYDERRKYGLWRYNCSAILASNVDYRTGIIGLQNGFAYGGLKLPKLPNNYISANYDYKIETSDNKITNIISIKNQEAIDLDNKLFGDISTTYLMDSAVQSSDLAYLQSVPVTNNINWNSLELPTVEFIPGSEYRQSVITLESVDNEQGAQFILDKESLYLFNNGEKVFQSTPDGNMFFGASESGSVYIGDAAPTDTLTLWVDSSNKVIKAYIDGAWTQVS